MLFENECGQEHIDEMVFAIQKRITGYNGDSLSTQETRKIVYTVYKEHTQTLRESSLPLLKRLGELLQQRRWEDPGVIEFKKR